MNLYHLRYFVTLAHLEHYTKAAELLSITQPSLSHAIAALESEVGVKLFEKSGRNVALTKYGQTFLKDVEQSLNLLDASVETMQLTGTGEGIIDVALLRTLSTDFVPRLARQFLDQNSDKKIDFRFHNSTGLTPDLIQGLKDRRYDIAFCSRMKEEPMIEFVPVAKQNLVVIVPPNHPLAVYDSIDLSMSLAYPQVGFSRHSGLRPIIDQLFEDIGTFPDYAYCITEDEAIAGLVSQGFGIAIVPDMTILRSMNVKILRLENISRERIFYMATLKNVYHAPIIDIFRQYVRKSSEF